MSELPPAGAVATLRHLTSRGRDAAAARPRCELCTEILIESHRHLLELDTRALLCACTACALRFDAVVAGRFALVPQDVKALPDFRISDRQWEALALPIDLAFFSHDSRTAKVRAWYPSPAGATESLLPLSSWESLVADNPPLSRMRPDVEALLVHRVGDRRAYFITPIDACFELVGLIRASWRGLSGGEAVWRGIGEFFARLEADRA